MTEALKRIADDFEAFRVAIDRCESAAFFQRADLQDAYARFARVRERYDKERPALADFERRALAKVFDDDTFAKGIMDLRQVSEHVIKRIGLTIRTTSNAPVYLDCETSARSAFAAPKVTLSDTHGRLHQLDHFGQLREAERRIHSAIRNARS